MKKEKLESMDGIFTDELNEKEFTEQQKRKRIKLIIILSLIVILIIVLIIGLIIYLSSSSKPSLEDKRIILIDDSQIFKPINTKIKTRIIKLKQNNFTIGIINDPNIKKTGISILIPYGKSLDLIYGFTNYAQNLIFGGSKKYTDNSLLDNKLNENDGFFVNSNDYDKSVYSITFYSKEFENIIEIFSSYFDDPNIYKNYAENEINKINSKFLKSNSSEQNYIQILSDLSNQKHPFYSSGIGNNQSLTNVTFEQLYNHIQEYYKYIFDPNKLKMMIYSDKNIEDIENYIVNSFNFSKKTPSEEFNKKIEEKINALNSEIIFNNVEGKIILLNIENQLNEIVFAIQTPKISNVENINILMNTLKIISDGTLAEYLNKKGYLTHIDNHKLLSIGGKNDILLISLKLTKKGVNNLSEVISSFYSYINFLKEIKINENNWRNYSLILSQEFLNKIEEIVTPYSESEKYVKNLLSENYTNFYFGYDLNYNKTDIENILNAFIPSNIITIVQTSENIVNDNILFPNPQSGKVRYYETPYIISEMDNSFIEQLKVKKSIEGFEFKLPELYDKYISKKTEKIIPCYEKGNCNNDEYNGKETYNPSIIKSEGGKFIGYYIIDKSFHLPLVKSRINLNFADIGTYDQKIIYLISNYLNYEINYGLLNEFNINKVQISVSSFSTGLNIDIITFSDLIENVIKKIIVYMNAIVDENEFNNYINYNLNIFSTKSRSNYLNESVKNFITFGATKVIEKENMDLLLNTQYKNFYDQSVSIFERVSPSKFTIIGDTSKNQVEKIINYLAENLKVNIYLSETGLTEKNSEIYYLTKNIYPFERENIVLRAYQFYNIQPDDVKKINIFQKCALSNIIKSDLIDKKQIGDSVSSYLSEINNYYHLYIVAEGETFSPNQIDDFMDESIKKSLETSCQNFDKIIENLNIEYPTVVNLISRFNEIISKESNIYKKENNIQNSNSLTYKEVQDFMKKYLVSEPRIIKLFIYSDITSSEAFEKEEEIIKNNKTSQLTPNIKKYITKDENFLKYFYTFESNSPIAPYDSYKILYTNDKIIKPLNTIKKYEIIELKKSKYKFILINDPKTLNGGLDIRSIFGFHTDIIDGFAHYAEHIFFGGTKNITELDLFNLVSQYNEMINAYTADEETGFQFFGSNYTFETLLEYISNFMQYPLFNKTYLKTEIKVVNSEYDNINYTYSTITDIMRDNSNPNHPFSQTITGHCGNKETLYNYDSDVLANYLENYYKKIFNPNNCVFLLYSSKKIEEMRYYAQKYFDFTLGEPSEEFNQLFNAKYQSLDNDIFLEGQLGKIAISNSLRETSQITFLFLVSNKNEYLNSFEIIQFLLNGNDENSLQNFLYKNNYISNFRFNNLDIILKKYDFIGIVLDLTDNGYKNIDKCIEAVFAAINSIKGPNIQQLLNNLKSIDEIKFKNKEEKETAFPEDIDKIISNYFLLDPENMLGNPKDSLYNDKVNEILNYLTPSKSFIVIDSTKEIKSEYITSTEIKYTKNYKTPYRINSIPNECLIKLNSIEEVDGYTFKIRNENKDYTNLTQLIKKPCYEESPYNCQYKEYDPQKNASEYIPYVIKNSDNIISLMKIDRSYGIPFVKGYINITLDSEKFKEYINSNYTKALYYFILNSFNFKFSFSTLKEAGTIIEFSQQTESYIEISFSTYNDLLDKVIQYIIDFFNKPIDEVTFNSLRERYYLKNALNRDSPHQELLQELNNIFMRFISVNSTEFGTFSLETVKLLNYSDFEEMFQNISEIKINLKYITNGDILIDQAISTTNQLSSLIKPKINLMNSVKYNVEIPEKTSIIYSLIAPNKYQPQGITFVMYEFDNQFREYVEIYTYCADSVLFDYIRTKRGSGYTVRVQIKNILNKNYLMIYSLGSVFSPEKMDRLINEGIYESFSFNKCSVEEIRKHLKNKANLKYAENKFSDLKNSNINQVNDLKIEKEEDNITYESIVEKIKDIVINKFKRIAIFYHRGNISPEELEDQIKELDKDYFFDKNVTNILTTNITYLEKYSKKNIQI